MGTYSSKKLSLVVVDNFIKLNQQHENEPANIDGLLLLTAFGFVYGKIHEISDKGSPKTLSDFLVHGKTTLINKLKTNGDDIISDGAAIILENAVVKYTTNNYTFRMPETIIFTDQIIGYYPIDLKTFEKSLD